MAKRLTDEEKAEKARAAAEQLEADAEVSVSQARGMSLEAHRLAKASPSADDNEGRQAYDNLSRLNWSRLKLLERSPAQYVHGRGDDSSGFALGTAGHSATLEPEKFARDYVVYPGKTRNGAAWEAFETEAMRSSLQVISRSEYADASAIAAAVRAHSRASAYLSGGKAEVALVWDIVAGSLRFECKGRADYIGDALVDFKTTKDASPKAFGASCAKLGYLGQAAWYSDGHYLATGQRKPFIFVAAESSAPHIVQVYRVTPEQLEIGRAQYLGLLGRLDYCTKQNFWGGYTEAEETDLELPAWMEAAA